MILSISFLAALLRRFLSAHGLFVFPEPFPVERMYRVRVQLTQRLQHKHSLGHLRMRDDQILLLGDHVVKQQQIQVQRPRSPAELPDTVGFLLQLLQFSQKFPRLIQSVKFKDRIEKFILIQIAVRFRLYDFRRPEMSDPSDRKSVV